MKITRALITTALSAGTLAASAVLAPAALASSDDDHESAGLYVGARNGAVWASADAGETWRQIVANLPDALVVRAAALP